VEGASEYLKHPDLGTLGWLPEFSHWLAQPALISGVQIDLVVDPGGEDRHAFLARATQLFRWAMEHQQACLDEAIHSHVLRLYNDNWRQDDLPVLNSAEFEARLELQFLQLSTSRVVPITYGYDPGELFGGHSVWVEVDAELRFCGAHLV
jgi:hypothetical protein